MESYLYYLGQFFGVVAIILGFLTYQMKSRNGLVILQVLVAFVFVIHYLLIGAFSGMALNSVALIRNTFYFFIGRKRSVPRVSSVLFAALMGFIGILSWQGWYSLFIVLGLMVNSYCMSFSNPQHIRKSILISSPLVLIYDCFVFSFGGIVYESVAIISAVIGIIRSRREPIL